MAARAAKYSYICQRVDYSDDPNEVRVSVVYRRSRLRPVGKQPSIWEMIPNSDVLPSL